MSNPTTRRWPRAAGAALMALSLTLSGCLGDHAYQTDHALGGSISGLTGSGLVIANGNNTLSIDAGATSFTLPDTVQAGTAYDLSVQTQPSGQTCSFASGSGTMPNADMRNAVLTCATNAYTLGGSISGLSADGLVLANGSDTVTVASGSTSFTLPSAVASGSDWNVTVQTQPSGQTCTVSQGSGQMGAAAVSSVQVSCSTNGVSLGGAVTGLTGAGLVLANGSDTLSVSANGSFTFDTGVIPGVAYADSVQTQPSGQTCSVSNGSGTMGSSAITNVAVSCAANSHALGGTVSGLSGSLVLANGADTLSLTSNGSFTLGQQVAEGGNYAVTVQTQPTGQTCSVSNGSGTMGSADISDVAVTCATDSYTLGGAISGLTASGLVLANGSDTLTVAANASTFTMTQAVAYGASYAITVQTQPTGLSCTVSNGSGTMGSANVSDVTVTCGTPIAQVTTYAGTGDASELDNTDPLAAKFYTPFGLAFDSSDQLYVSDFMRSSIRTIARSGTGAGAVSTFPTSGIGNPMGIARDSSGDLYVASGANGLIYKIKSDGTQTTLAGGAPFDYPQGLAMDSNHNLYVADLSSIRKIDSSGNVTTLSPAITLSFPKGIAVGSNGKLYVSDEDNHVVLRMDLDGSNAEVLAGSGSAR